MNTLLNIFFSIFAFLGISGTFFSQLEMKGLDGIEKEVYFPKKLNYNNFKSSCHSVRLKLIEEGYTTCSIDSIVTIDSSKKAVAYFYLGERYDFNSIQFDSITSFALNESGKQIYLGQKAELSPKKIARLIESVITYFENNGYPFVTVYLSDLNWNGNRLEGILITEKGPLVKFGKITIKGNLELEKKLLNRIINIEENEVFSQQRIDELKTRFSEVTYIKSVKETEYEIVNNECLMYLYLDKNNANSFNAILGVLPNDNGRINITGDVRIKLLNVLNKGELIDVNWRKLLPLTQNLNLHFNYPFILNSPIGSDMKFDLYKKDTSYLDLHGKIGFDYYLNRSLKATVFYENQTSSLLSTEKYQYVTTLPVFADITVNSYGVSFDFNNLNFKFNPSKGWEASVTASAGDKRIRKNPALNENLYEGLKLRTTQFRFSGGVSRYLSLSKRNVLKLALNGGWVVNDNVFENELFRLGGLHTLRGFDEESIFASGFGIGTLEYRFILEEMSNLFVFGEYMYYDKRINEAYVYDTPYSFGAGINFQTRPGIFSVSYSLGSQLGNPILFRTAKIHFGFVNYF